MKPLDIDFVGHFVQELHNIDAANVRFRYSGGQLPSEASENVLNIDFKALFLNLQRVYDVLSTLDSYLIETYGQNEEWRAEQSSW